MVNIFYLSRDPRLSAIQLCNKHVVKMIVQTAQLLYTCLWISNKNSNWIQSAPQNKTGTKGYKSMNVKHPCVLWLMESKSNYQWLLIYGKQLCRQYTYRYGRIHFCEQHIDQLTNIQPEINDIGFTQPRQAMPNQYKNQDSIKAYRQYYLSEKKKFAKWTKRNPPAWFVNQNVDQ